MTERLAAVNDDEDKTVIQSDLDHSVSWTHSNKMHSDVLKHSHTSRNRECKPYLQNGGLLSWGAGTLDRI